LFPGTLHGCGQEKSALALALFSPGDRHDEAAYRPGRWTMSTFDRDKKAKRQKVGHRFAINIVDNRQLCFMSG
jgi:hypothetical protein